MCCSTSENGVFGNTCLDQVSAVLMEECFMEVEVIGGVLGAVQSIPLLKLLPMKRASCAVLASSSNTASLLSPRGCTWSSVPTAGLCSQGIKWEIKGMPSAHCQTSGSQLVAYRQDFTIYCFFSKINKELHLLPI